MHTFCSTFVLMLLVHRNFWISNYTTNYHMSKTVHIQENMFICMRFSINKSTLPQGKSYAKAKFVSQYKSFYKRNELIGWLLHWSL